MAPYALINRPRASVLRKKARNKFAGSDQVHFQTNGTKPCRGARHATGNLRAYRDPDLHLLQTGK